MTAYRDKVDAVVKTLAIPLALQPADIQAIALADLTVEWLMSHSPEARMTIMAMHVEAIRGLVDLRNVMERDGHGGTTWPT